MFERFRQDGAMARIELVDPGDPNANPVAVEVLRRVSQQRARTAAPNVYRAMANHPEALRALVSFGTTVYFNNSMTPAQRELAYLTASLTNDCHY
jgi:alkylhydroperoxidase family enzyme